MEDTPAIIQEVPAATAGKGRTPVSARSQALGWCAAGGVALLALVQFLVAFGLPGFCRRSNLWRRQREVQELFLACDTLQNRLDDFKAREPVAAALVEALGDELADRRTFLQEHAWRMPPAQLLEMKDNVRRSTEFLERLAAAPEGALAPPLPELSIDAPVRAIINEE